MNLTSFSRQGVPIAGANMFLALRADGIVGELRLRAAFSAADLEGAIAGTRAGRAHGPDQLLGPVGRLRGDPLWHGSGRRPALRQLELTVGMGCVVRSADCDQSLVAGPLSLRPHGMAVAHAFVRPHPAVEIRHRRLTVTNRRRGLLLTISNTQGSSDRRHVEARAGAVASGESLGYVSDLSFGVENLCAPGCRCFRLSY